MALIEQELSAKIESMTPEQFYRFIMAVCGAYLRQDSAPVVHGRWVKHDGYTECSECEYWYDSAESEDAGDRPNYCPSCGARMDEGERHEAD